MRITLAIMVPKNSLCLIMNVRSCLSRSKIILILHSHERYLHCGLSKLPKVIYNFNHRLRREIHISSTVSEKLLLHSSIKNDILDTFTNKLMRKKTGKWFYSRTKERVIQDKKDVENELSHKRNKLQEDVCSLDEDNVNSLFLQYVHSDLKYNERIISLLNSCICLKLCPSNHILLALASKFSKDGEKRGIILIQKVCKEMNENEYINQCGYVHFLAEATWISGNTEEALQLFLNVYKSQTALRRKVRHMVKFFIANVVSEKGEAALVLVTNFSKQFASQHKDFSFLSYLWECCFLSEWFVDNRMACELVEQYPELKDAIKPRVHCVAVTALTEHEVEVVQRLLEFSLHFDMIKEYSQILRTLFDYKCSQGDLQGCCAIIQSSLDLNVCLTSSQHKRFLNLFLNEKHKWLLKPIAHSDSLSVPHFKMKF